MHGLKFMAAQEGKLIHVYGSRYRCGKQDYMITQLLRAYFAVFNGLHLYLRSVMNISSPGTQGSIVYDVSCASSVDVSQRVASLSTNGVLVLIAPWCYTVDANPCTVIPRPTKIIRSGITFVSRNLRQPKLLAVSNVNNPVGLVGLPYVMWSAHFFVTHIQTEKISSWNGPTVHVCCFMLARASTKTLVSRIHIRQPSPKNSEKNLRQPKNSLAGPLVSRGITVFEKSTWIIS